jgi:hypothetical protein
VPNYGGAFRDALTLTKPVTLQSGANVAVSTLTPLTGWINMLNFVTGLFAVQNLDLVNELQMIVETSQDAVHADVTTFLTTVPAGDQGSYEIGPKFIRTYFRLSAQTDSPGFPTVNVNWQVVGLPRA